MSTLAEIEAAADGLSAADKEALLLFLATRLRTDGRQLPQLRQFTKEQMTAWVAEDEADMQKFQQGA